MKRFVGLSLVCFMFASAHAEPNVDSSFSGSSWSVHMSQKNDEPIQVVSEQEEYDKNKILKHRKSRGFIDKNGVYKSVSEEDLTNSDAKKMRRPFKDPFSDTFEQDTPKIKLLRFPQDFQEVKETEFAPRESFFKFKKPRRHKNFAERKTRGFHSGLSEDQVKENLKNRSRVSFSRPFERMFGKVFEHKNSNMKEIRDLDQDPNIMGPANEFPQKSNAMRVLPQKKLKHRSSKKEKLLREYYKRQQELQDEFFRKVFAEDNEEA